MRRRHTRTGRVTKEAPHGRADDRVNRVDFCFKTCVKIPWAYSSVGGKNIRDMNMSKLKNRSNEPSQNTGYEYNMKRREKWEKKKKGACGSSLTKVLIISGILHTFPSAAQDERSTPLHHRPTLHALLHQAGTVYTRTRGEKGRGSNPKRRRQRVSGRISNGVLLDYTMQWAYIVNCC